MKTEFSKEQEISMIESLIEANGYFSDELGKYKEQMIQNIRNNFPLLYGTGWIFLQKDKIQKDLSVNQEIQEEKDELVTLLIEKAHKFNDDRDLYDIVERMVGLKEVIKRKLDRGYPLRSKERDWLLEHLVNE